MRVAVVAVGDELLLGAGVNGNLAWLGETLAAAGLPVVRAFEVADVEDDIAWTVAAGLEVADAVVVTGGLGPTEDDLTREALARLLGVPLVESAEAAAGVRAWFEVRGRTAPATVARQYRLPEGASLLPNAVGTAPGVLAEVDGRPVYALPGVPAEMRAMTVDSVVPDLRRRAGEPTPLVTRQLRVAVLGESAVAQRLAALVPAWTAPGAAVRLAYLASPGEVRVRFTGTDRTAVDEALHAAAAVLGDHVSGYDDETAPMALVHLLADRGLTLAVAESLTGGRAAATLVDVPGASAVLRGAVVAYATDLKAQLLGVDAALLAAQGPVHPDVARQMALAVRDGLQADVGLATTGVAGPDPQDGHPPGEVHLAVAGPGEGVRVLSRRFVGSREVVRTLSVAHLLDLARRAVLGLPDADLD